MGQQNSRRTSARDTSSNTRRRAMLASAIAIPLAGLLPASARAADLYYDGDATDTVGGGSGNWSVSLPRWGDTSTATTYGPWVDGSSAFFGGSGGLVDVTGAVSPVAFDLSANYAFLGNNLFIGGQPTTFNTAADTTSLIIGNVGGGLGLTKTGAGSLGFTGLMAPGAINVNEGTLFYASALSDLATANPVTVAAGATLRLGVINDGFGSLAGAGSVVLGSLPGYFGTTQGTNLDIGADNSSTTFSGNISGASGRFFKQGTGTLTLTGTNTNTGRIGVQAGILEVSGGSAISDASDVFISANSTLKLLSSERIGSVGAGTATTPKIELVNADLTLGTNTRNIQFNGVIVGTGSVTKVGSGIQQMTTAGAASTYTGGTFIKEGILLASGDAKLGQLGNGITLDGGTLSNFNTAGLALGTG